jgi:hypothetical protein
MMPYQIVADLAAEHRRTLLAEAELYRRAHQGDPPRQTVAALVLRLLPPYRFPARQSVMQGLAGSWAGRARRGAVPLSATGAHPRRGRH